MFPGLPDAQGQVRFMVEWVLVLFISCRGNPAKRLLTLSADKGRKAATSLCGKPLFSTASVSSFIRSVRQRGVTGFNAECGPIRPVGG